MELHQEATHPISTEVSLQVELDQARKELKSLRELFEQAVGERNELQTLLNQSSEARRSLVVQHALWKKDLRTALIKFAESNGVSRSDLNDLLESAGFERVVIRKSATYNLKVTVYAEYTGEDDDLDLEELGNAIDVGDSAYGVPDGWEIGSISVDDTQFESEEDID